MRWFDDAGHGLYPYSLVQSDLFGMEWFGTSYMNVNNLTYFECQI